MIVFFNTGGIKPCPKAIKHGQAMGSVAKQHYVRIRKENDTKFPCTTFLHIGASPIMLLSCFCCGDGFLEVNAPLLLYAMYACQPNVNVKESP